MQHPIIDVANLSKMYRISVPGSGSLRQDLKAMLLGRLRKKNAFFDYPTNKKKKLAIAALDNISFQVQEGEVLGIIGPNGAGKSTLLKLLSRVIRPTEGTIKGRGKISSLLEIGTGFHHELSGRENIFLSGYMLGMKKQDVKNRFDEIVAFSGIEQFLDTPVKRYSSGMYMRLAFAVAAHLEPDILIVDEVLAVGDAEFQQKCIGKMKQVSVEKGRTVLFVSHNMQAITNLCSRVILLQKGSMTANGDPTPVINQYLAAIRNHSWRRVWLPHESPGNEHIRIYSVELVPELPEGQTHIDVRTPLTVKFKFYNGNINSAISTGLHLFTLAGECIFDVATNPIVGSEGVFEGECKIPGHFLNDGSYYFSIIFVKDTSRPLYYFEQCLEFTIEDHRENMSWYGKWRGYVRPHFPFELKQLR